MKIHFNKITIVLLLLLTTAVQAFSQNLRDRVIQQFAANKNSEVLVIRDEGITDEDPAELLSILNSYKFDESKNVRFLSFNMGFTIGQKVTTPLLRKRAVSLISEGLKDEEALVWQSSAKYLEHFATDDFSNQAVSNIDQAMKEKNATTPLIRLLGVAQMASYKPALQDLAGKAELYEQEGVGMWYGKPSWAAALALSRMGDALATDYCISRVESTADPVLRVAVLLKDVAFTRSQQGLEVLIKYLNDTTPLPGIDGRPGVPYQQYALDLLAQSIIDFPIPSKGIGYTETEVATAINWLNNTPNYQIKR